MPASDATLDRPAMLDLVTCLEPCETGGFVARMRNGKLVQVSRQAARDLRRRLGLRRGGEDDEGGGRGRS